MVAWVSVEEVIDGCFVCLLFKIFFHALFSKSLLNLFRLMLLFYVLGFWLQGMWDPSSPTRD